MDPPTPAMTAGRRPVVGRDQPVAVGFRKAAERVGKVARPIVDRLVEGEPGRALGVGVVDPEGFDPAVGLPAPGSEAGGRSGEDD